jgi:hypothetical protein
MNTTRTPSWRPGQLTELENQTPPLPNRISASSKLRMKANHSKQRALQKILDRRKQVADAQQRFKQAMRKKGFERISVYLPADCVARAVATAKVRGVPIDAVLRETYLLGEQKVPQPHPQPSLGKKSTATQRIQREYEILRSSSVEEILPMVPSRSPKWAEM